ncbi:hypothetical protein EB822_09020 [Flavobacteriaceae bacterium PRS1]|nr:hypothetical protein EB822_09020 [Flavobacteriaceae bacterium PRS1]
MKKIVLVLLIVLVFACKSENKNKAEQPPKAIETVQKDVFTLSINAIVENEDTFILFFLEEGQEHITKKNSATVKVQGSVEPQEIRFIIKEEVLPTKLLLRFGNEQKAQKIEFLTTELSYGENSFIIEKDRFFQFFIPNKYIEYDRENSIAISKEIEEEYEPRFGSRNVLIDKIFYKF